MKVLIELDEQEDGKDFILMTLKAADAFCLLNEMDNDIRTLLKYGEVDGIFADDPESMELLSSGVASDTPDQLKEKNKKMIHLLESLRRKMGELIL